MKKVFLFSLGLIISGGVGMLLSSYATAFTSDAGLLAELFKQAGITETYSNDSKELKTMAANTELPFNNIYLFMLQNVMNGPQDSALESLSGRFIGVVCPVKYSKEDLEKIVIEGNIQIIIDALEKEQKEAADAAIVAQKQSAKDSADSDMESFKEGNDFSGTTQAYLDYTYVKTVQPQVCDPGKLSAASTNDGIFAEYSHITDLYDKEFKFQQDNKKLGYEALASEIFYNNDLSDSANIDLLYDLDLIHYLLFGEYITYPDRSDGGDVDLASEEIQVPEEEPEIVLASTTAVDPYSCTDDDAIAAALDEFESNPPEMGDTITEESTVNYDIGEDDASTDTSDGGGGDEETPDEEEPNPYVADVSTAMQQLDSFITGLEGKKGDWTRALPCGEVFCITVEMISETDDPAVGDYEETENCIACHVSYISERMTETTSKSLVPSKIPMNWFEDATCKEAGKFVNLDLNIYVIKKPITLDPDDDIDETAQKDIDDFKTRLWGIAGFPLPGGSKTILGKTLQEMECESILNITDVSDVKMSNDKILEQCQEAAKSTTKQVDDAYAEFAFEPYAQTTSDLYGQVSAELYTMLIQFQNFQEGLKSSYEGDDAPLTALLTDKEYCE